MVFGAGGVIQAGGVGAVAAEFCGVAASDGADAVDVETIGIDVFGNGVAFGGVGAIGDTVDAIDSGCSTKVLRLNAAKLCSWS